MKNILLEIAVFNFHSAMIAAKAGADRLELCENIFEGGTTASYGTLKLIKDKITIPVFPIIRPRGGDFLYNTEEYEVMKKDIQLCKKLNFEGVVLGLLKVDGTVDMERTKQLVDLAYPLEVTFHRAFDRTVNALKALEDIISCNCTRILTSGQLPNAIDGKELLKELINKSSERIVIMPGSGVRSNNINELAIYTGAMELHSSARKLIQSNMCFNRNSMEEKLQTVSVDEEEINNMIQAIKFL